MTPAQHTDAAWRIGSEFLTPFPDGWSETAWSHDGGWTCTAVARESWRSSGWNRRMNFEAKGHGPTPDAARRACREQAWDKHRKNTGEANV